MKFKLKGYLTALLLGVSFVGSIPLYPVNLRLNLPTLCYRSQQEENMLAAKD